MVDVEVGVVVVEEVVVVDVVVEVEVVEVVVVEVVVEEEVLDVVEDVVVVVVVDVDGVVDVDSRAFRKEPRMSLFFNLRSRSSLKRVDIDGQTISWTITDLKALLINVSSITIT